MNTLYEELMAHGLDEYHFFNQADKTLKQIQNEPPQPDMSPEDIILTQIARKEVFEHLVVGTYLRATKEKKCVHSYRFSPSFLDILLKTNINHLTVGHLPLDALEGHPMYFDCPGGMRIHPGGSKIHSLLVYSYVNPANKEKELLICNAYKEEDGTFDFNGTDFPHSNDTLDMPIPDLLRGCYSRMKTSPTLKRPMEMLDVCTSKTEDEVIDMTTTMFSNVLKMVLYVCSGEPDLRHLRASKIQLPNPKNKKAVKKFLHKKDEKFAHDFTFVGFEHMKERLYHKDSTYRNTHPRWQPCGPHRSQVKLVWVKGHPVHYKNNKKQILPELQ